MARALTTRSIESFKPGPTRREAPDGHVGGLYLIVQPGSGAKSWAVRYRIGARRSRKLTLGSYPAIDLKTAREMASAALRAVAEGRDPSLEKKQERRADSIEELAANFVAHHRKHVRARHAKATEWLINAYALPRWKGRLAKSISRADVLDVLDRAGPRVVANRILAAVGAMFSWAVSRDKLAVSPCLGIKKPVKEQSRERVLDDGELVKVWLAADRIGGPAGALVKALILTGQRRGECAATEWREL